MIPSYSSLLLPTFFLLLFVFHPDGQSYSNYGGGGGDLLDLMDDEPSPVSTQISQNNTSGIMIDLI